MSLKGLLLLVPIAAGGWYMVGGSIGGMSRDVDRPPEVVAAAISDLDIRRQPGTPGTMRPARAAFFRSSATSGPRRASSSPSTAVTRWRRG